MGSDREDIAKSFPLLPSLSLLLPLGMRLLLNCTHLVERGLRFLAKLDLSARRLGVVATAAEERKAAEPKPQGRNRNDQDPSWVQRNPPSWVRTADREFNHGRKRPGTPKILHSARGYQQKQPRKIGTRSRAEGDNWSDESQVRQHYTLRGHEWNIFESLEIERHQ
jgi:hypothetical protein